MLGCNARVRIRATKVAMYPDVSVICGRAEVDDEDDHSLVNPILLVEVLSESTERYDRGAKLAHYRAIPSAKVVLLVRQDPRGLELFAKQDDGTWVLHEATTGELRIDALDIALNVDELYRDPLPD